MYVELIFSVMQAAFLFTVVGTTGFLGILAGQLPGVASTNLPTLKLLFVFVSWACHGLPIINVCVYK